MPQVFKVGGYTVYFWTNEGNPLEPVHVHVGEKPRQNGTKLWLTKSGKCMIANNNSKIPDHTLNNIVRVIEKRIDVIIKAWINKFGEISYYC